MRTLCASHHRYLPRERPMRLINMNQWNFFIDFVHKIQSRARTRFDKVDGALRSRCYFMKSLVYDEGSK